MSYTTCDGIWNESTFSYFTRKVTSIGAAEGGRCVVLRMCREEPFAGGLILRVYLRATKARDNEKSEIDAGQFTVHVGTVIWMPGYLHRKLSLNTTIGNWEFAL